MNGRQCPQQRVCQVAANSRALQIRLRLTEVRAPGAYGMEGKVSDNRTRKEYATYQNDATGVYGYTHLNGKPEAMSKFGVQVRRAQGTDCGSAERTLIASSYSFLA